MIKTIKAIQETKNAGGTGSKSQNTIKEFAPLVMLVDSILFLSVEPGFYGAKFVPEVLDKINEFRKLFPGVKTAIDGGVKEDNVKEIARTGVNAICVGSAIFNRPDPAAAYRRLVELTAKV